MIHLKINNQLITVIPGTTILEAAKSLGITIPTMCYLEGYNNHPSCMICIVKDQRSGNLVPSCSMLVEPDMDIITDDEEIQKTRKESLELLMSDHVGDCEAPCRIACPAFMNIPLMNRLIASGDFAEAIKVVKEDIALPFILGFICSAPCEKVCRRKQADNAVSICMLKRFVAEVDSKKHEKYFPEKAPLSGKKVAVIGSGPAGLACAFYLVKNGHSCIVYESKDAIGGSLAPLTKEILPKQVLDNEVELLKESGVEFKVNTFITKDFLFDHLKKNFEAVVFATGEYAKSNLDNFGFETTKNGIRVDDKTFMTSIDSVFACGSSVAPQKMAIKALAQGKEAAYAIHDFLMSTETSNKSEVFNSKFGLLQPPEIKEYLKEAVSYNRIEPVGGFLNGFSEDEAMAEARRCMHCDCRKADNCKLRIYSEEYKIDRRKYSFGDRKTLSKHFQHELVVYEPEKCIRCGLCIEIASKKGELIGFTFIGRGFDVRVDIPFNKELSDALILTAYECANACPTGAISIKNK